MEHKEKVAPRTHVARLNTGWVLWVEKWSFQPPNTTETWAGKLSAVAECFDVQRFWSVMLSTPRPSDIVQKRQMGLYLFRKGIVPQWEDPQNRHGGKWSVTVAEGPCDSRGRAPIDTLWEHTAMGCVGEQLGSNVCGCVVRTRARKSRIDIWVTDDHDDAQLRWTGLSWQQLLLACDNTGHHRLIFKSHHREKKLILKPFILPSPFVKLPSPTMDEDVKQSTEP